MIGTYLAMQQNAMMMNNMAVAGIMESSNRMQNSISANNSQPLRPSFAGAVLRNELDMKSNETKVTISQKLMEAYEKALGKNIKKSTPKYTGIDYMA